MAGRIWIFLTGKDCTLVHAIRLTAQRYLIRLKQYLPLGGSCQGALSVVDQNVLSFHLTAVEASGGGRQVSRDAIR